MECALEAFAAPASLREIGEKAFMRCERLRGVRLNEGLRRVGAWDDKERCFNTVFDSPCLPQL